MPSKGINTLNIFLTFLTINFNAFLQEFYVIDQHEAEENCEEDENTFIDLNIEKFWFFWLVFFKLALPINI